MAAFGWNLDMTVQICLHGAESTGKSTLAPQLAAALGAEIVPEYGRLYCEEHGLDLSPDDLNAIFRGHVAATEAVLALQPKWLIADTDPLMTQAWSIMLFGERIAAIDAWTDTADLYLVPALDLDWKADGTRFFGSQADRQRFMDIAIAELDRRALPWAWVKGRGPDRLAAALAALQAAGILA